MKIIGNASRFFLAISLAIIMVYPFSFALGADFLKISNKENDKEGRGKWRVDIVGFNYTNRFIDSFSVNGVEAGNIFLSSRTNGGGKTVCCVTVPAYTSASPRIRVRWQVDGCTYLMRSKISREVFENLFFYHKQKDVALNIPDKINPRHLEVHFNLDGTVSAQLTESISLPRVSLDGRRSDISNFPGCLNDKKPE